MSYIDAQEVQFQENQVSVLARQVQDMTENIRKEKNIQLELQIEGGVIYGDPDLILSLFSNLIDNARKACPEGGRIWLEGRQEKEGYCFCLKDNGCGMPEEEIHKITEPFYMIDKSRARKEGGAGIGMALCQKIIRMHHAGWEIQSRKGEGTQIRICFPKEVQGGK